MIQIRHLNVQFTGFSLQDVCLSVARGAFFVLLGPTGAGKTLILESIAGLVPPYSGRIQVDGRDVTRLPPERRGVGIVYQDHALFPHLNVRQNITYGLRYRHRWSAPPRHGIEDLADRLGLAHLLDRSVAHLSGGEKQRTALARALAVDPAVLLLDEPLSSLDPNFRGEIRQLLKDLHGETGITILMVTHDFSEAHFLAGQVAVINAGRIEQVGDVTTVFQRPATPFAAEFVGMKNIFAAKFEGGRAVAGKIAFRINGGNSDQASIAIRPEHIRLFTARPKNDGDNILDGVIIRISNQGVFSELGVAAADLEFQSVMTTSRVYEMNLRPGGRVFMRVDPTDIHLI